MLSLVIWTEPSTCLAIAVLGLCQAQIPSFFISGDFFYFSSKKKATVAFSFKLWKLAVEVHARKIRRETFEEERLALVEEESKDIVFTSYGENSK